MRPKISIATGVVAFVAIVAALVYMGGFWPGGGGVDKLRSVVIGGPFTLEAGDGRVVTDRTYRAKWQLIYFGYTLCPDACPTALNNIAGALKRLGPLANDVQPIFITIDPARDTPKVVTAYAKAFDDRFVGLTGTPAEIADAARNFRVFYAKVPAKDAPDGYLMDHSSEIYLMRPRDFAFVTVFDGATSADQLAAGLRQFIARPT